MKYGHTTTLSSTLLFRKGGATPVEFLTSQFPASFECLSGLGSKHPRQPDPNAPVRISLKIDRVRRQHLQLAAARLDISSQELLVNALDHYLRSEVPAQIAGTCCCLKVPAGPEPA